MTKNKRAEPSLEVVKELAFSKDGPVLVAHLSRGFLSDVRVITAKEERGPARLDGKEYLIWRSERLRAHLDGKGLPTDKWRVMPIELDRGYHPEEHGVIADEDLWLENAEEWTEPLTEDRLAAEFLHAINRALARFDEDQLRDVYRLMRLHHQYSMAGELNDLALEGQGRRKDRRKGPQSKSEAAHKLRALIVATAKEFWRVHPRLVGQLFNTAKKIGPDIDKARKAQVPDCKPLAVNTIYNHLRAGLDGAEQNG
jgi:hypothetical protein